MAQRNQRKGRWVREMKLNNMVQESDEGRGEVVREHRYPWDSILLRAARLGLEGSASRKGG